MNAPSRWDVLVVGGGLAGLTAAIAARHRGCSVLLLDAGSSDRPGGNTRHSCAVRLPSPPRVPPTPADLDRFGQDLAALGSAAVCEPLIDATILGAAELAAFMEAHGAAFSAPYLGVVEPEPSMHFLVGGGLALVRAYVRLANRLGVVYAADATVSELCSGANGTIVGIVAHVAGRTERIDARSIIVATGGSESVDAAGVPNAVVRGGAANTGGLFRAFAELDATFVGDGLDLVAVDARSPEFDGGSATAIDAAGFGILIDSDGRMLYDSSASEWSVARTEVGSAVAGARGGRAAVCWDGSSHGRFAPTPWA
ncbi:MAG TPA: FAD-dependent oxidoreductase, partial [Acidimicrobiales bacterium]|nr:FAD-dependent oxidoreductase [Acidimicrobiales bacterium]